MIKVVLVDRQPFLHEGIARILSSTADIVLTGCFTCLDEQTKAFLSQPPDVLLLDITIADVNHIIHVLEDVRCSCPGTFVIGLAASPDEEHLRKIAGQKTNGIVCKTDSPHTLIDAIYKVVQGESWFSASLSPALARLSRQDEPELTEREVEVLKLVAREMTDRQIALALDIAPRTVRFHLDCLHSRLGTTTRTGAVVEAIRRKLI